MWGVGLVAVVAATTGVLACRQLVGITDNPPEDLVTSICGLPYGTNACASCVNANCCTQSNSCAADPSCAAYQACFGPCNGDPACWSQCIIDNPATGADVSALSACMASNCETDCKLTCGGFAGRPFPPSTASMCESCLTTTAHACSATRACATSVGCDTAIRCISASPTYDLINTCELTDGVNPSWGWNPDAGNDSALTQYFVAQGSCGPACSGTDWHCVGRSWPELGSVSTPYTMNLLVHHYSDSSPEPDAAVEVCGDGDLACSMSYAHGTTDAHGEISLTFQNVPGVSPSHGIEGYLKISGADFVTNYTYWGFPLSGSAYYIVADVVTPSELATGYDLVDVKPDTTRGTLVVVATDCQYGFAPGVQVTLDPADPATESFSPSGAATSATDSSGLIFFYNVPAGLVQVTATPPGSNRASSHVSANVWSQAETIVWAFPTP
jgi:hypothetical protein